MRYGGCGAALCAVMCLATESLMAQTRTMSLAEVLALAREQAPAIVSERLAIEEVRGRLAGASLRFQTNPELEGALGNRSGPDQRFTDYELGLGQSFEPGSRRRARIDTANAAVSHAAARLDETTRLVLRSAADLFYRAVHARARVRLLTGAEDLARRLYDIADRRFRAGDIAVLEVNLARASLARARAQTEAAEASSVLAVAELKQLTNSDADLEVAGDLMVPSIADLEARLQAAAQRPELRALEAELHEAESESALAGTFGKPDFGVGVRYAREEGDQIVLGTLALTLPVFSSGQEQRAVAGAKSARIRVDLDAARARIRREVRSTFDAYGRRLAAVRVLDTDAMPGLDDNEALTARSFEVGQLGLADLLLIRREILETRFQHLDALLEAALARVELDAGAAILR